MANSLFVPATIASSLFDQKINTEITGGAFVNP
jgi:hypothetical protein